MISYDFIDACDHIHYLFFPWRVIVVCGVQAMQPGMYNLWRIFQDEVNDFSNNIYKGYGTLEDAQEEY
jgi:hypothetical protein